MHRGMADFLIPGNWSRILEPHRLFCYADSHSDVTRTIDKAFKYLCNCSAKFLHVIISSEKNHSIFDHHALEHIYWVFPTK